MSTNWFYTDGEQSHGPMSAEISLLPHRSRHPGGKRPPHSLPPGSGTTQQAVPPKVDPASQIHDWTNSAGVTIKVSFVRLDGDSVAIKKDGKEFTILYSKLNTVSQQLARRLAVLKPQK